MQGRHDSRTLCTRYVEVSRNVCVMSEMFTSVRVADTCLALLDTDKCENFEVGTFDERAEHN